MRIAIIGGGASGMACAWLLDSAHSVTLFEAAPALGGHVRTLGANVEAPDLPPDLHLDAGVIEFGGANFPTFHRLLARLGVPAAPLDGGSTGLFFRDGHHLYTPSRAAHETHRPGRLLAEWARFAPGLLRLRRFARDTRAAGDALSDQPIGEYLDQTEFGVWVRALLMYAYSTDYAAVDGLSAAIAAPMLVDFLRRDNRWMRLPGGVYTYLQAIRDDLRGEVLTACPVTRVERDALGVTIHSPAGRRRFEQVVFAAPPDRALALLASPTDAEARRFQGWTSEAVHTVVHTDSTLYSRRGVTYRSEFDLFEQPGGDFGYNAYLNRLCDVPAEAGHYHLAFGMQLEVDPARILHVQPHVVPRFSVDALRWRREVIADQGARRTFFAGAWLGDGLHEGAVTSALAVSERLGGRSL